MSAQEILAQELDFIIEDLKAKHIQLKMKASGKWLDSLEQETTPSRGDIFAEDYTEFLVDGRGPGGYPPIDKIKAWIEAKGLTYDIPINSLAFLIARKIAQQGTEYYKDGGTDLIEAVITPARVQSIIDRVGAEMMLELIYLLERTFQETAAA